MQGWAIKNAIEKAKRKYDKYKWTRFGKFYYRRLKEVEAECRGTAERLYRLELEDVNSINTRFNLALADFYETLGSYNSLTRISQRRFDIAMVLNGVNTILNDCFKNDKLCSVYTDDEVDNVIIVREALKRLRRFQSQEYSRSLDRAKNTYQKYIDGIDTCIK